MADSKTEYINNTQGFLGASKINRKGDEVGVPIAPSGRIFLTEEEKTLTEQAQMEAKDSPFLPRTILHFDSATGDKIAEFVAPPLESVRDARARKAAAQ